MTNLLLNPVKFHEDDKAQRWIDVVEELEGQINIVRIPKAGTITAFHRHIKQDDLFFPIKGSFKVGLVMGETTQYLEWIYLSDRKSQTLFIPRGHWHGIITLEPDCCIMYYLSNKYSTDDIQECPIGSFGEIW